MIIYLGLNLNKKTEKTLFSSRKSGENNSCWYLAGVLWLYRSDANNDH